MRRPPSVNLRGKGCPWSPKTKNLALRRRRGETVGGGGWGV